MIVTACLGLVAVPACLLIIWFLSPLFKDIMVNTVEGWGAAVGLSGFALMIANIMPVLVPLMCFGAIITGLIGLARGRSSA